MKSTTIIFHFLFLKTILLPAQTEGWTNACLNNSPVLAELMIDACGNDEFYSEYIIVRTQEAIFNARNFQMRVENPANGAFVGSVTVTDSSANQNIIDTLNKRGIGNCTYGIVFRDAFALPYKGFIPANSPVLIFNNKNNTDIAYLNDRALAALCGSKVFVIFGTLRPQSPGQPVFRNFPPNNSCGNTGCLREVKLSYDNNRYCQNLIYDIKKVAHPNINDPNAAFLGGGYIRTADNNGIVYGSDNVRNTSGCMPPLSMLCRIPPMPDYGAGFWNILAFDGLNDFSTRSFKGFYQTKDYNLGEGSFEFNTARQGWKSFEKPSEAHPTFGAMTAYNGCEVKADSFSYQAKRYGFPCGFYRLNLARYDDYARIRIDADGNGTFEFDQSYNPPACRTGCNSEIWQGDLGYASRMEIWSYDIDYEAQIHLIFNKIKNNTQAININYSTTPSVCNGSTGSLNVNISGGTSPYSLVWSNSIPPDIFYKNNLAAGVYTLTVTDAANCQDSARIFIPQLNNITLTAQKDTTFCAGGVAQLRGVASGATSTIIYEWSDIDGQYISNQANTFISPSFSTSYVLKITNMQGCFKTDTVSINVHTLPLIRFETINDNRDNSLICNNNSVVLKPTGTNRYCWSGLPKSVEQAFNIPPPYCQNNSDSLIILSDKLLKIEAPYALTLIGIDEKGCENIFTNPSIFLKSNKITKKDSVLNATICAGDSLFFNNKWHKITGKDSLLMKTPQGCDSIVYLNLKVKPVITRRVVDSTCNADFAGKKDTTYITYQNGCDSLIIITETVWSSRSIKMNLELVKPISCAGKNDGSVGVRNILSGNPPYKYIWNTGDTTPVLKNLKKGTYTLRVRDNNDCSVIEKIELEEPPPLSWEVVGVSPACSGQLWGQVQINNITGGVSPYSIRAGIFNHKNITTYPFRIDSIRTGKTDVFVTDKNGCKLDTSFIISNASKLLLSLENRIIALGDSQKIDIKVDYPVVKAQWQPSKGLLCDTCLITYVKPTETTKYKLTLTDKNGCTNSYEMMVYVEKERHIYAPTVFSPTHTDIRNQRFILYANREVERFKRMQIFNRWGNLIYSVDDFKSGDLSKGWDGSWQGKALAPDVFIYYATILYVDGREEIITGDVTLKK